MRLTIVGTILWAAAAILFAIHSEWTLAIVCGLLGLFRLLLLP